ncbi:Glu S.griseus protease inhibitor [Ananas comosus]|uniref:Glu S.griseus protease inhibitor n=1 Tax=Ananas comosus TaxID=4615 RepID=A0A199VTG5_ANACO|nr:Glu S.griseus protease inhibitor [Ananas comosus]
MSQCDKHDPSYHCPGKSYWPELVGAKPLDAKAVILSENPHVDNVVIAVYPGIAPPDFCCNRVYVWIDRPDGTVKFPPMID